MKTIITILILFLTLTAKATTYYVGVAGNNANDGLTAQTAWGTLSYASSRPFLVAGDVIHVGTGHFYESDRADLEVGISIEGEGMDATYIHSTYNVGNTSRENGAIRMHYSGITENGNQTLSHFTLDGDLVAQRGIVVWHRENVTIHHVRVIDCVYSGIVFWGSDAEFEELPSHYQRGNSVYNCELHNCASNVDVTTLHEHLANCLRIGGQDGFLCHNNNLSQIGQPVGENSDVMGGGENKNLKIYDNTFTKYDTNGSAWHFFFELFHLRGGCEVYRNTFRGNATADFVNIDKGEQTYGLKFYDNTFDTYNSTQIVWPNPNGNPAIDIECRVMAEEIEIYNNVIKNIPNGLWLSFKPYTTTHAIVRNIQIHHNTFLKAGSTSGSGRPLWFNVDDSDPNISTSEIKIYNNTIQSTGAYFGIEYYTTGSANNIYIRNNIITGCDRESSLGDAISINTSSSLAAADRTINGLHIQNNLLFDNSNSNAILYNPSVIINGTTTTGNVIGDPMYASATDLHLLEGSPAIDAGLLVPNLSYYGTAPDIGTYEFIPDQAPVFTQIGPLCQNSTPPSLPSISANGITGTWNPATISTGSIGTITYTFTPTAGQNAVNATMDIAVNTTVTPTFTVIPEQTQHKAAPLLPTTSLNGITGVWNPSFISTTTPNTTTYTFTPDDECATPVSISVKVNKAYVTLRGRKIN